MTDVPDLDNGIADESFRHYGYLVLLGRHHARVPKRGDAAVTYDDEIEQVDTDKRSGLTETATHGGILGAWLRVTGRMIVDGEASGGSVSDQSPKDFSRLDVDAVQ
jgi:hypothetical protein